MKIFIGIVLGLVISVGLMSIPKSRLMVLGTLAQLRAIQLTSSITANAKTADPVLTVPGTAIPETEKGISDINILDTGIFEKDIVNRAISKVATSEPLDDELPAFRHNQAPEGRLMQSQKDNFFERETNNVIELQTEFFQVVWTPFRSQMSAQGFAEKLQRQLDHEFVIIKRGPGKYEVGFHFTSDAARSDVLDAIVNLTGFASSNPPRVVQL
ncbi:MAG: hypothetical protein VB957_13205 [Pseudomonadales bacterium]